MGHRQGHRRPDQGGLSAASAPRRTQEALSAGMKNYRAAARSLLWTNAQKLASIAPDRLVSDGEWQLITDTASSAVGPPAPGYLYLSFPRHCPDRSGTELSM